MSSESPRIAIVVLNHNGKQHLGPFFESLSALDYPADRWRCILVDNGSSDGSVEYARGCDHASLIENQDNLGFSVASNQGARAADEAQVVCFLNNDMRVEPAFLRELVAPIVAGDAVATTAKMLSWDGSEINSAGGGMNFHGIGIQKGFRDRPAAEHDLPAASLFACGAAMAIDREVFEGVGGFDEDFFAYYEDVDLGWRLWVMGHEVRYVPRAVCYHQHSSTSRALPRESIRLLQVRNPVLACFKNYDDANLQRVLPAALSLALRRMHLVSGVEDERVFRIEDAKVRHTNAFAKLKERLRSAMAQTVPVRREAVADLIGLNDLFGNWNHWVARRQAVQSKRQRSDDEIAVLFDDPLWCIEQEPSYRELHDGVVDMFDLRKLFPDSKS
ncbi:MAG: glycosyltransferase family 2 protein [bacterium]|nr:glycosyltransferase family 2 protein [bacterium]